MEDKQLLFDKIFTEYRHKIHRLCYGYTRDEMLSEDLLQDCFSKIWVHLPDFSGRSDIGTWIYRIAANTCLMQLRKAENNKVYYEASLRDNVPEDIHEEKEERSAALFKAIGQLKETDRLIITMVLEDISQKQIGEILGITENNVNIKVHRIKKQLKELMLKSL